MNKFIITSVILITIISCGTNKHIVTTKKSSTYKKAPVKKKAPVYTSTTTKPLVKNEVLESTSRTEVSSDMIAEYVLLYKDIAIQNMREFKIPASIILAQGVLESGSGRGILSMKSNNHFGIKCHTGWTGDSVTHDDDQKGECFRKYDDPSGSYRDHALFLTSRSRYASLFDLESDDYQGWAKGLREAGYATDRAYPQKLIGLIERYQLYIHDQVALGNRNPEPIQIKMIAKENVIKEPTIDRLVKSENLYKVAQGDTLYSISKKLGISIDQIVRLNSIIDNSIAIGQILRIK